MNSIYGKKFDFDKTANHNSLLKYLSDNNSILQEQIFFQVWEKILDQVSYLITKVLYDLDVKENIVEQLKIVLKTLIRKL